MIKQRTVASLVNALLLLVVGVGCGALEKEETGTLADARPNIIFILTDDQRFDALGYAGNPLVETPEMDRLAREGAYFSHALVTTPICAASRATILSGRYERTHRYDFQATAMRDEYMADSYPIRLREAGYRTGFYGKFGLKYAGQDELFDESEIYDRSNKFADYRGYFYQTLRGDTVHLTRYTGERALEFIRRDAGDKPFCLSLSFSAPHAHDSAPGQYFWQPEQDAVLADVTIPPPALADQRYFDAQPAAVRNGFNRLRWGWRYDTPEKFQHSLKGYYRMITGIDREIARIRAELLARGLAENTVIILMGDNGQFLGERGLAGKWLMYDNSIRVPLIIYDPRRDRHLDLQQLALNVDVPSTILDLAGATPPASWQGQSLVPLLDGNKSLPDRDTVLIEHLWDFVKIPPSEGVRTRDWKYFRYVNQPDWEEMYNLRDDPQETINLAGNPAYASTLRNLRGSLERLMSRYSDGHSAGPVNLRAKYDQAASELSWELPPGVAAQTAYQVLGATSEEKLAGNIGDVIDGKEVKSDNLFLPLGKRELPRQMFWKVRIWDEGHRLGGWSETAAYTRQ